MAVSDYAPLIGVPHVKPHGCWLIVARALAEVHGVRLPAEWGQDIGENDTRARALLLHEHLAERGTVVTDPAPGDVIACWRAARPIHVALYCGDGQVLESTSAFGTSHLTDLPRLRREWAQLTYHRPTELA
jgi:cell wall-associated NlpC family hydrolase